MNPEADKLYKLLPALYRVRDAEHGEPLRALCAAIAEDIAILRENLDQLYDDQFIETCADWVAPYIGELIGYRSLHGVSARTRSARAEVANTMAYRRRKGTATVLEQLARDVTGWNARVVEFFQSLQTSQYMNRIRPAHAVTPDLRDWEALERRDTAFNTLAHSVDMRRIETQQGRYNIPNIGLYLWRLDAFSVTRSPAFRIDDERYLFSPLGHDVQLFTRPETETEITHLAEPLNVPDPIGRRVLARDLARYYGPGLSLLVETNNGGIAADDIRVCNLSDDGASWAHLPVRKVSIDPVLGRMAFPPGFPRVNVRVSYHHAFSMAMGGGEYERRETFALDGEVTSVARGESLQAALRAARSGGIVEIADNGRYDDEEALSIVVDAGARLELRAANEHRPMIVLPDDLRIELHPGSELTLNGLVVAGRPLVAAAGRGTEARPAILTLRHCTFVPGLTLTRAGAPRFPDQPSLLVDIPGATVDIDRCILGGLRAGRDTTIKIANSMIDATGDEQVAFAAPTGIAAGGVLTLVNSTVIGRVHTSRLELASNSILMARPADSGPWRHPVISDQNQHGCVRFCFVPPDSIVPRRYRCQPDLAIEEAILKADQSAGSLSAPQRQAIRDATLSRVRPVWTTLRYGRPAYGQLGRSCPGELRTGAEDESEMGAFHDVFAPQREGNLRIRLQEYLRFGLEVGIFYST
jgi:hypothetical protein